MTRIFALLILFLSGPLFAQEAEDVPQLDIRAADGLTVDDFHWQNRLVLVFADSEFDPRFTEQMDLLTALPHELIERDVVVIADTDPSAMSALRTAFRPRGFMLLVIGKDGSILQRKPFPWDVREISAAIDKTPIRQQELSAPRE